MRDALLTSYSPEETEAILTEIQQNGFFNETQRRFGLHYRADQMLINGDEIREDMKNSGIAF